MAEIIKNTDGLPLKNPDGLILKGNYDFGKGFKGQNSTNIIIRVPALVGRNFTNDAFTIAAWEKFPEFIQDGKGSYSLKFSANGMDLLQGGTGEDYLIRTTNNISFQRQAINARQLLYVALAQDSTGTTSCIDGKFVSSGAPAVTATGLEYLTIGASTVTLTRSSDNIHAELLLFERRLTQAEMAHIYNNGQGNEPISIDKLLIFLKLDKAEILDFSATQDGSDLRVGVRNSGTMVNGHGQILGLPAGTLQEQTDFANLNWFKLW
jgi:hypothetical protein